MNYLPKDDFINIRCDCLDSNGFVTVLSDNIGECEDKEFQASTCPNGAPAKGFFCKFLYYQRSGVTIKQQYTNIKVWASTGHTSTYFKLEKYGVYDSTQYDKLGSAPPTTSSVIVSFFYSVPSLLQCLDTTTVDLIVLIALSGNEDILLDFAVKALGSDDILLD